MKVTSIGHAGYYIETASGSILCDPWVNPAYFASWFPFPDNSGLDWDQYRDADYLYVSHLHRDHYDPDHLRQHVSHDATVLLPDYKTDDLENALRQIGFKKFRTLASGEPVQLAENLRVMILALTSPSDGPIGDSAIAVDDGEVRIINQNDAKPVDFEQLHAFGPYDAHLLQFSGANWWPVVYDLPDRAKAAFGRSKRSNGLARALRYVNEVDARFVVPSAGPPAFLDDELFGYNEVEPDETHTFPTHPVFVEYLREHGRDNSLLQIPGSVLELTREGATVTHPVPEAEALRPYTDAAAYLREYAERMRPRLEAEKASWPAPGIDVLAELKPWFEPLLKTADQIATGVGAQLLLQVSAVADGQADEQIVIDFIDREVRPYAGEKCRYRLKVDRPLIERLIADHEIDWVNSLFLSMRFQASRVGPYNEFIYTFFKCLSPERMEYAESYFSQQEDSHEEIQLGDWLVQRKCPHRQADLGYFGEVHGDTLLCTMHRYEYDLKSGRCVTANDKPVRARRVEPAEQTTPVEEHAVPED